MRRKFEELRENLDEFASQDEYPFLLVGCTSEELAYVLTFAKGLDATHPEAHFFFFTQPFVSAALFVDGVAEAVRQDVAWTAPSRAEAGEPPHPPLPSEALDRRLRPEQRLFALLMYLRGLLPNETEFRMFVGLLPLEIRDPEGYARLVESMLPVGKAPDWMKALRILAYDDRRSRRLLGSLRARGVTKALTYEIDFSTPALTAALAEDAANASVPVMDRMMCVLQLAAVDYAYKRYPDALTKYTALYSYFAEHELPDMQSLCLLGAGDVHRATGKFREAKERYQQGLALALSHNALAPLLNLLVSVMEVCFDMKQYEEACGYAEEGTKVAAALLNFYSYCDFYERWGDALVAQGKTGQGLSLYAKAHEQATLHNYTHRWESVLGKIASLFREARMRPELDAVETELRELREVLSKRAAS